MPTKSKNFRLGQLANFGQTKRALGKVIRATACGAIERQLGVSLCYQLNILLHAFEIEDGTVIRQRLDELHALAGAQAAERLSERSAVLIEHKERDGHETREPLQ
jgi:hypothetical protein